MNLAHFHIGKFYCDKSIKSWAKKINTKRNARLALNYIILEKKNMKNI